MRRLSARALAGVVILTVGFAACQGKVRRFTRLSADGGTTEVSGLEPTPNQGISADGGEEGTGEALTPNVELLVGTECETSTTALCGPDTSEGICEFGLRRCVDSAWTACEGAVFPAERDCRSGADNDCDGRPDNSVDEICRCIPDSTRACEEHPGSDGRGPCRAGLQVCVSSSNGGASDWGACMGSVGPSATDSCVTAGDDSDCDGTPNSGCPCVDGTTVPCGPELAIGTCSRGVSTCMGSRFSECMGAVFAEPRNCGSNEDNDCDGKADDALDDICVCQACNSGTCFTVPAGQPGHCTEGKMCDDRGLCVAPNLAALTTLTGGAPAAFDRTLVDGTAASPRTWAVQNTGGSPTSALQFTGTNDLEFQVAGACIGLVLQPGASCSLSITFTPRNPGRRVSTLRLTGGPNVSATVDVEGPARIRDGRPCSGNGITDCDSNMCTEWLVDADGDGFGAPAAVGGFPTVLICGDGSAANRPTPYVLVSPCGGINVELPYVNGRADCCDRFVCPTSGVIAGLVGTNQFFPNRVDGIAGFANCVAGSTASSSDFNCDGRSVVLEQTRLACNAMPNAISAAECSARSGFQGPVTCGQSFNKVSCALGATGLCQAQLGSNAFPICL